MRSSSAIINVLQSPVLLCRILSYLRRQNNFLQKKIFPWLDEAKKNNDGTLDENDFKKITHYYGLAVPAILGEAFSVLRGWKMSEKERMAGTCQGAMTGLFDDFFDKQNLPEAELKNFIENPITITGSSSNEKLFLQFYTAALENASDASLMLQHLYKVYHAQVLSKQQAQPGLSQEQIQEVTWLKGGASVLFYRSVLNPAPEKKEEDLLFALGALMQLSNDIFDVYKDYHGGIHTLVTTATNIDAVRQLFTGLMQDAYRQAYQSGFKKSNVKKFIDIISIGIFSRCFVCLDQLEKTEAKNNNRFMPGNCSRKELICDMDTASGKWNSLKYHIRFAG